MKEFLEKIVSLDNIHQWEERDSAIKESVSQHSFKVAAIAIYLLEKMECTSLSFYSQVVTYATLHDFDESIIKRDLAHPIKYNELNGDSLRKLIDEYVNNELKKLDLCFVNRFSQEIKFFVKLCDWIALMTFISRNKKMGNVLFEETGEYCLKSIRVAQQNCCGLIKYFNNYEYVFKALEEIENEW